MLATWRAAVCIVEEGQLNASGAKAGREENLKRQETVLMQIIVKLSQQLGVGREDGVQEKRDPKRDYGSPCFR